MKYMGGVFKTLGALAVAAVTYVDNNLGPLFWILLACAGIDLILNIHKDHSFQFRKLGAAFFALGAPGFVASNAGHLMSPEVLKVLVAILTIGYLQVVVPQILALLGKIKFSKDPTVDAVVHQDIQAEINKAVALALAEAKKEAPTASNIAQASIGGEGQ